MGDGKMQRHVVCSKEELPPGEMRVFALNKKTSIAVGCNREHEYFAVRDVCPHQGAQLSRGKLTWKTVADEPCTYGIERDGEILRCPWHSFDYDTRTGQSLADPKFQAKTYKVSEENGKIVLEI